jgi:hypothetical protein
MAEPVVPMAVKLGLRDGSSVVILHPPRDLDLKLPPSVVVHHRAQARCDVVVAFYTRHALLEKRFDALRAMVFPSGGLWIAWPKRSSRVATDITDHSVRGLALPRGLVDNKVCAMDETWTGLRLVWRRELRRPRS